MKVRLLFLLLTIGFLPGIGLAQDSLEIESLPRFSEFRLPDSVMTLVAMDDPLSMTIDNYFDDVHMHLTSVAEYDAPNPYLFSILGGSPSWTHFRYHDVLIDNPLRPGDARYHFETHQNDLVVDRNKNLITLNPSTRDKNLLKTNLSVGGLGGRVGFADWFINNISGHESARQRAIFNIDQRPQIQWLCGFTFHHNEGKIPVRLQMNSGSRQHLDQNFAGENSSFNEDFFSATGHFVLKKPDKIRKEEYGILLGVKFRSHDLAEFHYSASESRKSREHHLTIYRKGINQNLALHIDHQRLDKYSINLLRNIIDQDGEGLEPYYQDGSQYAGSVSYDLDKKLSKKYNLNLLVNLNNSIISFNPENKFFTTNIYRQSTAVDYLSLHTITWESMPFSTGIMNNSMVLTHHVVKNKFEWSGEFGYYLSGIILRNKSIVDSHPHLNFSSRFKIRSKWAIGLNTGYFANPFTVDQAKYLSPDYMTGSAFHWIDANENMTLEPGEKGSPAFNTGGTYREKGQSIGLSSTLFIEIPLKYNNHSGFQLTLTPQYRQFRNTWHTQFQGNMDNYGQFIPVNDQEVFFKNPDSQPTMYEVVPYPTDRIQSNNAGENGFLLNQPFYAGITLQGQKQTDKLFISASFTANMVLGTSGFGNGPLHNHLNTLSESTADPNLVTNNTGRLDSDRSFISRWILGYKINEHNRFSFQLKYKDGQSFANYEQYVRSTSLGHQIAFTQREVRGDNPLNGNRGRREDFTLNIDVKFQHIFPLSSGKLVAVVKGFNLLDFGNETLEYTFGNVNGFDRAPLELQVPRSILLQLNYLW